MRPLFAFSSAGNDSVAVVCHLVELGLPADHDVAVVYSDTGWAAPYWAERVERLAGFCRQRGMRHEVIPSKGFERLVREEGNRLGEPPGRFPTGKQKFCTRHLKIIPAQRWLAGADPEAGGICAVGVRREESERRRSTPVFVPSSPDHGGRPLWHPLAEWGEARRNELLERHGWEPLDHRSDECEPCIFSARADLRRVGAPKVDAIRAMERDTGKVMFRPRAYAGAEGIDEVMRWAWSDRGQYRPEDRAAEEAIMEDATQGCESSWCGA